MGHSAITIGRRFRDYLKLGIWFRVFRLIGIARRRTSPGHRIIRWIGGASDPPPGAAEVYQLALVVIGLIWIALLGLIQNPVLAEPLPRHLGAGLLLILIADLFLFCLDWIFAEKKKLDSTRRSLATFLVALVEIAAFSTIVLVLLGCASDGSSAGDLLHRHLIAIIRFDVPPTQSTASCMVVAHGSFLVGLTVLGIVIASLVGGIARGEERRSRRNEHAMPNNSLERTGDTAAEARNERNAGTRSRT